MGLWPLGLVKLGRVLENPFKVAMARSDKAGAILADVLAASARSPVILVAFSLGARAVMACLEELGARPDGRGIGLVEAVVVMGSPIPAEGSVWRRIRTVVVGRVVNVYSASDWILRALYRPSPVRGQGRGVAGLGPVLGVDGIENLDASELVPGHAAYRTQAETILRDLVKLEL